MNNQNERRSMRLGKSVKMSQKNNDLNCSLERKKEKEKEKRKVAVYRSSRT